jgi:hypothetical protein
MVKESNPGYAGGIAKRSGVMRLAWALKGAPVRKKDLRLNALSAIAEGRKLRDKVTGLMLDAGATPEDAIVLCVFAKPDLSAVLPNFAEFGINNGPSDFALVKGHVNDQPIGFLVIVIDRQDPQQCIFGHARPLLVEGRGLELNEKALRAYERVIKGRLNKGN